MKIKLLLAAMAVAGLAVSSAVAAPPEGKGKREPVKDAPEDRGRPEGHARERIHDLAQHERHWRASLGTRIQDRCDDWLGGWQDNGPRSTSETCVREAAPPSRASREPVDFPSTR
jgi:hypothetical protein